MTISELKLKSRDEEPVRRLEIFTGSGRRREWLPDEKARIVAESYETGETVSAVARRYALSPQQLFAWRRGCSSAVGGIAGTRTALCSGGGDGAASGTRAKAPSTAAEAEGEPRCWPDRA
ncbi:MAG: hypothetical protein EOR21_30510 [Mesorhizobium sp.]|nr:transposase [Mesorhizobium sp.]RWI84626.1 MAG: hypothetical protein EOR21_30510 [Mesorhizobium sp.]